MINEPNCLGCQGSTGAGVEGSSRGGRGGPYSPWRRWLWLIGGGITGLIALAGSVIVAQMSGCCGGAPTHGCKFVEVSDAAMDASADAMLSCGPNEVCVPGQTTCCLEAMTQPPLRCIPVTAVCKGQSANCASDQDCPAGAGLHCCGTIATLKVQCQPVCSGDFQDGGTLRVCRSNAECPAERPVCGMITINSQTIYACVPANAGR